MEANPMTALLSDLALVFTQCTTWFTSILSSITGNPVLLILVVAMPVIGFAFGLLRRLIRM